MFSKMLIFFSLLYVSEGKALTAFPGNYVVTIKGQKDYNTMFSRLGFYEFKANGTVEQKYWSWQQDDSTNMDKGTGDGAPYTANLKVGTVAALPNEPNPIPDATNNMLIHYNFWIRKYSTLTGTWTNTGNDVRVVWSNGNTERWKITWKTPSINKIELFETNYTSSGQCFLTPKGRRRDLARNAGWGFGGENIDFSQAPGVNYFKDKQLRGVGASKNLSNGDARVLSSLNEARLSAAAIPGSNPTRYSGVQTTSTGVLRAVPRLGSTGSNGPMKVFSYFFNSPSATGIFKSQVFSYNGHDFNYNNSIEDDLSSHRISGLQIIDANNASLGYVGIQYQYGFDIPTILMSSFYFLDSSYNSCDSKIGSDPDNSEFCFFQSYNSSNIKWKMVSADFDGDGIVDDIGGVYRFGASDSAFHTWIGDHTTAGYPDTVNGGRKVFPSLSHTGSGGFSSRSSLEPNNIRGLLSGDFDNDGKRDDIAIIHRKSSCETEILVDTGQAYELDPAGTWFTTAGYCADAIGKRVVSGDFDGDGKKDDIAAFYDYGNGQSRIHVWLGNGSKMIYQGATGWFSSNGYSSSAIDGRVVAADFNHDGKDDIATLYNYGASGSRIHMFLSTGSSFSYQGSTGWYSSAGYSWANVKAFLAGDFDRDGQVDDIAVAYDYGASGMRIHHFINDSPNNRFLYQGSSGAWSSTSFDANLIVDRMVVGDFDKDGFMDDLAAIYNESSGNYKRKIWRFGTSVYTMGDAAGLDNASCSEPCFE